MHAPARIVSVLSFRPQGISSFIVGQFSRHRLDTYAELSPPGKGVHAFLRGAIPGPGRKINGIELYCHSRYFTVTGQPVGVRRDIREALPGELDALRAEGAPDTRHEKTSRGNGV